MESIIRPPLSFSPARMRGAIYFPLLIRITSMDLDEMRYPTGLDWTGKGRLAVNLELCCKTSSLAHVENCLFSLQKFLTEGWGAARESLHGVSRAGAVSIRFKLSVSGRLLTLPPAASIPAHRGLTRGRGWLLGYGWRRHGLEQPQTTMCLKHKKRSLFGHEA